MRKKKHTFILLEVTIALLLFSLISLPLVRMPLSLAKKERALLQKIEDQRLVFLNFTELKANLHKADTKELWEHALKKTRFELKEIIPTKYFLKVTLKSGKKSATYSLFIDQK